MQRLIAIAGFIRKPAVTAEIRLLDGKELSAAWHSQTVKWRAGNSCLGCGEQLFLRGMIEITRPQRHAGRNIQPCSSAHHESCAADAPYRPRKLWPCPRSFSHRPKP